MTPQTLFVLTVAASLFNGLASPALLIVYAFSPVWLPEVVEPIAEVRFYGASLIVASATLLVSGVPAALSERLGASQGTAMHIWLAGALLLALLGLAARM